MPLMKSDGNGGFVIQKGAMALIMIFITLVSCVTTVVAYGVTIKGDVDHLKSAYDEAGPRHTEVINKLEEKIEFNSKTIIQYQEKIISIQEDITEIKSDVKELIKR